MGILSDSINLFSKSISKFKQAYSSISFITPPRIVTDSNNNKLDKLLVRREINGSIYCSRLPIGQNIPKKDLDFTFPRSTDYFIPIASCNSLVLVNCDSHAALWNPTTDEIKPLPNASVSRPPSATQTYADPYGLGFDRASQDYKVIRFLEFGYDDEEGYPEWEPGTELKTELYSLKNDTWKEIPYSVFVFGIPEQQPSIHVNGFYYWFVPGRPRFILSFDFAGEKFASIPLPESDMMRDDKVNTSLAEFRGSLAVLVSAEDDHNTLLIERKKFEFEIWVWNDGSWIRVPEIDHVPPSDVACVRFALGLFNNDQLYLEGCKQRELLVFDCTKRELKYVGLDTDPRHMFLLLPYVESEEPIGSKIGQVERSSDVCL